MAERGEIIDLRMETGRGRFVGSAIATRGVEGGLRDFSLQAPLHGLCITHGVFHFLFLYQEPCAFTAVAAVASFLGASAVGSYTAAQHSTLHYRTFFRTASFTHHEGFSLLGGSLFVVSGWIPGGTLYGGGFFFLCFGGGEVDGGYVYMSIWRSD